MFYQREDADPIQVRLLEDQVYKFQLDVAQWVEANGSLSATPTVTVRSGNVAVSGVSYSGSVITMYFTQTSEGSSRVEIKYTDGTSTGVQNVFVRYIDRDASLNDDYGI